MNISFSAISDQFLHAHSPKEPRVWKSAVFQRGHFNLSVCLIFPVVGHARDCLTPFLRNSLAQGP